MKSLNSIQENKIASHKEIAARLRTTTDEINAIVGARLAKGFVSSSEARSLKQTREHISDAYKALSALDTLNGAAPVQGTNE